MEFQRDPALIVSDFELAPRKAVRSILGEHVKTHGCFYHLTESTWRIVQSLRLVPLYRSDPDVMHFCAMLDGLAFLHVDDVSDGLAYLRTNMPDESLSDLLDYFDNNYVNGTYRRMQRPPAADGTVPPMYIRHLSPLYPVADWNVHKLTLDGGSRTNNTCESWNLKFKTLLLHSHPTIWRLIDNLRKDEISTVAAIAMEKRQHLAVKR